MGPSDHNSEEWVSPAPVRTRTPANRISLPSYSVRELGHGQVEEKGGSSRRVLHHGGSSSVFFSHTVRPSITCLPFRQESPLRHVHRPRDLYHREQELAVRGFGRKELGEKVLCMVYYPPVREQTVEFCPNIPYVTRQIHMFKVKPMECRLSQQMKFYQVL